MIKHKVKWDVLDRFVVTTATSTSRDEPPRIKAHLDLDNYLRAVGLPVSQSSRNLVMDQVILRRALNGFSPETATVTNADMPEQP